MKTRFNHVRAGLLVAISQARKDLLWTLSRCVHSQLGTWYCLVKITQVCLRILDTNFTQEFQPRITSSHGLRSCVQTTYLVTVVYLACLAREHRVHHLSACGCSLD